MPDRGNNRVPAQCPTIEVKGLSNTGTLEERPTFRWSRVNLADTYVITLSAEETDGGLWQTSTTGAEAPYPDTMAPLRPNRHYRWTVEARREGDVIARKMSCFYLPRKERSARLRDREKAFRDRLSNSPGDAATRLAFIFFLEENNLFDQALEEYATLRKQGKEGESIRAREEALLQIRGSACE